MGWYLSWVFCWYECAVVVADLAPLAGPAGIALPVAVLGAIGVALPVEAPPSLSRQFSRVSSTTYFLLVVFIVGPEECPLGENLRGETRMNKLTGQLIPLPPGITAS